MNQFPRISHDLDIMGGKACIKGTRVTVSTILSLLSEGKTSTSLLEEYPYLTQDDISEALRYSSWLANSREMEVVTA